MEPPPRVAKIGADRCRRTGSLERVLRDSRAGSRNRTAVRTEAAALQPAGPALQTAVAGRASYSGAGTARARRGSRLSLRCIFGDCRAGGVRMERAAPFRPFPAE